jgi:hypothetical protein
MHQCFIYRRGLEKETRTGESSSYYRRIGVKADDGWGTYFTPRRQESYNLLISVFPNENTEIAQMVNVQVIGSGWK